MYILYMHMYIHMLMTRSNSLRPVAIVTHLSLQHQATPLTTADLQKSLDEIDLTDQVEGEKDDLPSNETSVAGGSMSGLQIPEPAASVWREEEEKERGKEEGNQRGEREEGEEGGGGGGGGGEGQGGGEGGALSVPDIPNSVAVPLKELLSNESKKSSQKTVNPFAKLRFMADSSSNHFVLGQSQRSGAGKDEPPVKASEMEGSSFKSGLQPQLGKSKRGGHPPQSGRKGLSLKVRKRKFVASPSKPPQGGKPAKLVSWRRGEEKDKGEGGREGGRE